MKTKLEMAHEYLLRFSGTTVADAWAYADAMQAEADKREKEEAVQKRKAIREMLNADNTFLEKEGQHFDDVEWQPDWSQAPEWANWWAMDKNGKGFWHSLTPSRDQSMVDWVVDFSSGSDFSYKVSPNFNYTGDWRDSLRKRPN